MTKDGELQLDDIKQPSMIKLKLLLSHVSNVLGTINDVKTIAKIA